MVVVVVVAKAMVGLVTPAAEDRALPLEPASAQRCGAQPDCLCVLHTLAALAPTHPSRWARLVDTAWAQ